MIKSVKVKNFQSWSELEFEVSKGVCLIRGFNHDDGVGEGSGKSAILNSICWCLFGQIPKDANIDDVIKKGEKSCQVLVVLSDGFSIQRSRKPNDLYLISPESASPIRGKDVKETQKLIERHIGLTYETFLQSVYFAQNSLVKFLLLNEDGKGKILSQIADLQIFDDARVKAHNIARETLMKLTTANAKLESYDSNIKLVQDQINSLRDVRIKFESDRTKTVGMLELKKADLEAELSKIGPIVDLDPEYYQKLNELKGTEKNYSDEVARLKAELSHQSERQMRKQTLEKQIKDTREQLDHLIKTPSDHNCDSCGSILTDQTKENLKHTKMLYIQQKTKELEELNFIPVQKLEEEYAFYESMHKQILDDLKQVEVLELQIKHLKEKRFMINEQVLGTKREIEAQKQREYPDIDKRIELLQTSLFQRQHEKEQISQDVKTLSEKHLLHETLKDGFKEVKSYAFQDVINELNDRTNHYLSDLFEQSVQLKFLNTDGSGEISKITTQLLIDNEERPLGLFSGGQTRRIMLAVDLALSDIIHSRLGKTDKLLILDEYFKDLSEESMLKVSKLLQNRPGSTIMVEHNSLLSGLANNVFEVEYRNGESHIKY